MWPDAAVICMSVALSFRTCKGFEAGFIFEIQESIGFTLYFILVFPLKRIPSLEGRHSRLHLISAKQRWYRERMAFRPLRRKAFLYFHDKRLNKLI